MFRNAKFLAMGFACPLIVFAADTAQDYPPREALQLVAMALRQNPALAAAHLEAEASHSTADHHGAWNAPEIAVDFYQTPISSFPNPVKNEREVDYSVSQTIPFPGKLDAMARPHHLHGAAGESHAQAMALDLRRQILSAYADLYAAQWRGRLIDEDKAEVERLREAARAGYEGGTGSQADLLREESEEARLDAEGLQAEEERAEAHASLSSFTGEEDSLPHVDSLFPTSIEISLDSLKKLAIVRRPDLEALRRETDMAQAEVDASGEEAYPDFTVSGAFKDLRDNTGASQGFWSVGVGMQVPFAPWSWKGVRAGVDQARILKHKSEQDYASLRLTANAEVERATVLLASAQGRIGLAQDRRIPLAEQALRSTLAAYQGGKENFNDVLTAFRDARAAREEYHAAVSDHLKAWAALEWATGGELSVPDSKD